ncbi:RNA polymerase sigma-70 factor [Paenibacillus senegalensis]|uniref:RNA polymerase sigma-70 factor n=1 Tax=Paenibacillus senegalensis TaxID=1465766 RepID=UPI000289DF61|nr:RNA polymerase sigma-70 factor [Paenibacillus senegalensis]
MQDFDAVYKNYRSFLFSIAYQMLGTISDAEDVIHDVFHLLQHKANLDQVKDLKAYLAKMTTNRCLNLLRSARKRREVYTGEWLPEPQVSHFDTPADKVMTGEAVSYAFLVMLDLLSPLERAVFILREALEFSYDDIAPIIEKTESNTRKIYSRAKQKLQKDIPAHPQRSEQVDLLADAFLKAASTGQFTELIDLLTEDVVLVSDGGGKVRAAIQPIVSKTRVAAFLTGISGKGSFLGEIYPVMVNGQKGVLQVLEGKPKKVICFEGSADRGLIQTIFIMLNPDKLKHVVTP